MVVGHHSLAEQRLDDGRAQQLGDLEQLIARAERALAGEDRDALAAVQDLEGARDARLPPARARPRRANET